MGLIRWFTRNRANTHEPTHPDLAPVELPLPAHEAVARVAAVIGGMPRWRVESSDPAAGALHATRRTRLWRFADDVRLTFAPTAAGTLVHADSRSRVGVGDLGQNRRNILELWRAVRANAGHGTHAD